ncbi:MAG: tetratricopeptide repeat protein [Candidatus Kapabacteria bacterium]|nr:tetratricopeptide repeat protein [Candidatus Kapabacteria bacterium]
MKLQEHYTAVLEQLTELRKTGNYIEAKELLFTSIMKLELQKNDTNFADSIDTIQYYKARFLSNLSAIHHETGETKASEDVIKQAIQLANELTDKKLQAQLLGLLGISLRRSGNIQQSIEVLRKAVNQLEEIGELQTSNRFKADLSSILFSLGSLEEALTGFKEVSEYFKSNDMDLEFLHSMSKIASLFDYMGDTESAVETMKSCLTVQERNEYIPLLVNIYGNLSGLFIQLHDVNNAIIYLEKAKVLQEKSPAGFQNLHLDIHSIDILNFQHKFDEALQEIASKIPLVEQKKMYPSLIQLHLRSAGALLGKQNFNEAVVKVKQAEQLALSTSNELYLLDCYDLMSNISEKDKKLSLAIEYKQKAIWEAKQQFNRRLEKQYTQELQILNKLFIS